MRRQVCVASVLQCVAVCCSVLQCVAMTAELRNEQLRLGQDGVWYAGAGMCYKCVAVCCSVLQCVAVWFSVFQVCCRVWQGVAAWCSVVQRGAVITALRK